jgi:hypothetical protein
VTASTIFCRSCGKSRGIGGTYTRASYATWFTVCGTNLITGSTSTASPRVAISSTCEVGQKIGVSLPLLTYSPSAWTSRLLYRRGRKSRRDLWITLYFSLIIAGNCNFNSFNFKNSCNLARHTCTTPREWHWDVEACTSVHYINIYCCDIHLCISWLK